jgi:hypothetical protein
VARVRQSELAVRQASVPYPLARIGALLPRLVLQPGQFAEAAFGDRQGQRFDVVEVQVDRGRGDAHLAGNRAQRQRRRGRIGQQAAGGLDDVVAQPLALAILTYTIIEAPGYGWLSATTLGLGGASVALLALFVAWEARSGHPMPPLHLFRNPRFTGAGVTLTVLFFALSGAVFVNSQILQFVLGYSPLAAGVRALPSAAALAVFSPLGAWMAKRAGTLTPVALGLAAVTAGLVFFSTASAASGYGHYIVAMVIVCAGIGLAMSAATSASMQELSPAMAGVGSAVNDTTRNMGSVLGVAVIGSITASVFASRMAHLAHGTAVSLGAAAAAAHHAGGAYGTALLHETADAFVTGADRAVLAGAIATLAGAAIAARTLRTARRTAVPAGAPVPVSAGAARG